MRIVLDVSDEVAEAAAQIARKTGIDRDTLLSDALKAQFLMDSPELRTEFDQWESASEIDAAKIGL